jgi:hypothetical protein
MSLSPLKYCVSQQSCGQVIVMPGIVFDPPLAHHEYEPAYPKSNEQGKSSTGLPQSLD